MLKRGRVETFDSRPPHKQKHHRLLHPLKPNNNPLNPSNIRYTPFKSWETSQRFFWSYWLFSCHQLPFSWPEAAASTCWLTLFCSLSHLTLVPSLYVWFSCFPLVVSRFPPIGRYPSLFLFYDYSSSKAKTDTSFHFSVPVFESIYLACPLRCHLWLERGSCHSKCTNTAVQWCVIWTQIHNIWRFVMRLSLLDDMRVRGQEGAVLVIKWEQVIHRSSWLSRSLSLLVIGLNKHAQLGLIIESITGRCVFVQ